MALTEQQKRAVAVAKAKAKARQRRQQELPSREETQLPDEPLRFGAEPGPAERAGIGFGSRLQEIATAGTQPDPWARAQPLGVPGVIGAGTADVMSMIPAGRGLQAAGRAAPVAGRGLQALGRAISNPATAKQAAVGGGLYGAATMPERGAGAFGGAAGGAIGQKAAQGIGGLVRPNISPGAREMVRRGLKPTPAQYKGEGALAMEDRGRMFPFVRDMIDRARKMNMQEFNESYIKDAMDAARANADIGPGYGREAIDTAHRAIARRYDEVLEDMPLKLDDELKSTIDQVREMAERVPREQARAFNKALDDKVLKDFRNETNTATGESFKEADSFLRQQIERYSKSQDPYQQQLGDAFRAVRDALRGAAQRQNPARADELSQVDQGYAMISRIEDASSYASARNGVFSPQNLLQSMRRKGGPQKFGRGQVPGQREADVLEDVMPGSVPDPRKAGGLSSAGLATGILSLPKLLAVGGPTVPFYSEPGRAALRAFMTKRPEAAGPIAEAIRSMAPQAGVGGAASGIQMQREGRRR